MSLALISLLLLQASCHAAVEAPAERRGLRVGATVAPLASSWRMTAMRRADAVALTRSMRALLDKDDGGRELRRMWADFKREYGKKYATPMDDDVRMEHFRKNLLAIAEMNEDASLTWWAAPNQFLDVNHDAHHASATKAPPPTDGVAQSRRPQDAAAELKQVPVKRPPGP